jgi:hypothetical protein
MAESHEQKHPHDVANTLAPAAANGLRILKPTPRSKATDAEAPTTLPGPR